MDFTATIAAPAIAAMQANSDLQQENSNTLQGSLHPIQENLLKSAFSVECKGQRIMEVNHHPYPLQQKLMRRLFSNNETNSLNPDEVMGSDPKPLRQQPEPKVKISLRRRITDSADLTWKCEMAEEGPFVFEEVL